MLTEILIALFGVCAPGMVHVQGDYCPAVSQPCLKWADAKHARCAVFAPSKCVSKTLMPMDFCIDQFEYPNVEGELPSVQMSWYEAKAACESDGKRLCDEPEITFACEGEEMTPYPYGYVRDQSACNIDKEWRDPWVHRDDGTVAGDRQFILLDQRVPSGSMPLCVSPFGVFDIVGNADEWAVGKGSMYHAPYASILHGGHWGKVRDRCRGTTTVHGPDFKFYVTGARCCSDASR